MVRWIVLAAMCAALVSCGPEGSKDRPDGGAAPGGAIAGISGLFGSTLVDAQGKAVPTTELAGKKVGAYCSAHWCPPCKVFTPKLIKVYQELRDKKKPFEIVFVSYDNSQPEMEGYMREAKMPWLAMPFDEEKANAFWKRFKLEGIPALLIFAPDGKLITLQGRDHVEDNGAAAFETW